MNISVRLLNEYLSPADVTAVSAEQVLTDVGFPIESAAELPSGDVMLDVEVTSNRGDCLSHIGLAREIAAATGRRLRLPEVPERVDAPAGTGVDAACGLDNRIKDACPMFTIRVIKGVTVGPSPEWLVEALESVGQRSINNVVDVTNYVMFEYGQPSHVFDLNTIAPGEGGRPTLIIRNAEKGEPLTLLDGRRVTLRGGEMVVADPKRAVSLAGVMGGAETEVGESTVDVLLEAATWDPVRVRTAARRLNLRTDASHRFERIVDPRTIDEAARRAADLIVRVAGGTPLDGVIEDGAPPPEPTVVPMRPHRCRAILDIDLPDPEIQRVLEAHGIEIEPESRAGEQVLGCTVPPHRPDLTREIDLIEEVARTHGLDELPTHEKIDVRIAPPQPRQRAVTELAGVLTGHGFFEAVTFTFVSPQAAAPFLPKNLKALRVCDERRKAEPVLRPSVLPSLLACRRANQDGGVSVEGGVRLYEIASVFASDASGNEIERRLLAMIADVPPGPNAFDRKQAGIRLLRGVLDAAAAAMGADGLRFAPAALPMAAYEPGAGAEVMLGSKRIGVAGLIGPSVQSTYDLRDPVVAAEVDLESLIASFPPRSTVHALPEFPAIERDVSLIVPEEVVYARIEELVGAADLALLDGHEFVGSFRGKQIGAGRKSVTVRLRFRDETRTLRHEEVDPQVGAFVDAARETLGAEVRA